MGGHKRGFLAFPAPKNCTTWTLLVSNTRLTPSINMNRPKKFICKWFSMYNPQIAIVMGGQVWSPNHKISSKRKINRLKISDNLFFHVCLYGMHF